MTGTTELITNLTDLIPRMSAFDATVVLRERIETNAPDKTAIDFVIMFFNPVNNLCRFSSCLNPEQIPSAKKQLTTGIKTFAEMTESPCASSKSNVLVDAAAAVDPEVTSIIANTGTNAYI